MLINRYIPFTAVLVPDDHQAIEVIRTLAQYNIQVPQEVSVISLMTGIEGERYTPRLPGLKYRKRRCCSHYYGLLDDAIKGGGQGGSDVVREYMGRLVIRQSVRSME